MEIPEDRLPPGFAASLDQPRRGEPPAPAPAATIVLLRDGAHDAEVFLLRRNRSSGFVPGAYVFPGGRVDPGDADTRVMEAALGLPNEPAAPFWIAALREAFEETGVLLVDRPVADLAPWRELLLQDRVTIGDALQALGCQPDFRRAVHIAHWITPVVEPRRFDTHFFAAVVPHDAMATPDAREMSDAVWVRPDEALERFRAGRLPMVFPTVRTLEALAAYSTADEIIDAFRDQTVRTVLPRLVRTANGVGIVVDDEET